MTPDTREPDRLWTQKDAAAWLGVSVRYLRDSGCPKILLPSHGAGRRDVVRYDPVDVREWAKTKRVA